MDGSVQVLDTGDVYVYKQGYALVAMEPYSLDLPVMSDENATLPPEYRAAHITASGGSNATTDIRHWDELQVREVW